MGGLGLFDRYTVGDMVGGDQVQRSVSEARPQRVAVCWRSQGRRDDIAGARDWIRIVVALFGQDEVVRAGLGCHAHAGRLRLTDFANAAADERWTMWTGASAMRANASARAVATAST